MAPRTKIYFATDLHGSSKCFRKFVNAGTAYGVDVLVLGGDVAGKALQTIVRGADGRYRCSFIGTTYEVEEGPDLEALEKLIADHGYYPYRAEAGELDAPAGRRQPRSAVRRAHAGAPDRMAGARRRAPPAERQARSSSCSATTIRPSSGTLLDEAPWGVHDEGQVVMLDDDHEMISWGYSNITPWHSHREMTEDQLATAIDEIGRPTPRTRAGDRQRPRPAVRERARRGAGPRCRPDRPDRRRPGEVRAGRQHRRPRRPARDPAAAWPPRAHPRVRRGSAGSVGRSRSTRAPTTARASSTGRSSRSSWTRSRPTSSCGAERWPARRAQGLLVAVDVGTSGARAAAFDLDGRRLLEARRGYPTRSPRDGWAEQDGRAWRSAAIGALADLVRASRRAASVARATSARSG